VLSEGSNIFVKNLQGEMDIQRNCQSELQKKTEQEVKELKAQYARERKESQA
jgi:hypothetical protein